MVSFHHNMMRGRAEVARQAHNLKVACSSHAPAIKSKRTYTKCSALVIWMLEKTTR